MHSDFVVEYIFELKLKVGSQDLFFDMSFVEKDFFARVLRAN